MINKTLLEERLDQIISPLMHSRTPGMALIISRGEEILIRNGYVPTSDQTGYIFSPSRDGISEESSPQAPEMQM